MKPNVPKDHIHGGFKWEIEPTCLCGQFAGAVKEKFIFVSKIVDTDGSMFYFMPVNNEGDFARSSGVSLAYCPWCGTKISARRKSS